MRLFLISGKSRAGKDTFADFMIGILKENNKKVIKTQMSKYLKYYIKDYFGWDGKEETKPRTLLQMLGTDIIRKKLNHPLFFIKRTLEDIEIMKHFFDYIIISDVRFPEEIDELKKVYPDLISINIIRPNYINELNDIEKEHISENALLNYKSFDYKIINDKTLDDLKEEAIKIMNKELK